MPFSTTKRIFILSPASCSGRRAEILLRQEATFDLATRLRTAEGVTLGEAFAFVSGLYFRGKLAYASHFGRPDTGLPTTLVITAGQGLLPADRRVTVADMQEFAEIPIDIREPRYERPLARDAKRLASQLGADDEVVLLGSIATAKYRDVLADAFGDRLRFPVDFIGRGDMSRGGLLLRCVDSGRELDYVSLAGTTFNGARPARLPPKTPPKGEG